MVAPNSNISVVELNNLVKVENLWTSIIGVVFTLSEEVKYNSGPTISLASELKQSRLLCGQKPLISHDEPCCQKFNSFTNWLMSTPHEIMSAGFSDEGIYLNFIPFL